MAILPRLQHPRLRIGASDITHYSTQTSVPFPECLLDEMVSRLRLALLANLDRRPNTRKEQISGFSSKACNTLARTARPRPKSHHDLHCLPKLDNSLIDGRNSL
jgi:hypothetical protein